MRLLRLGSNAHMLETPAGALLFSYEALVALRIGAAYYRLPGMISTATRAHMARFAPDGARVVAVDPRVFAIYARNVVTGGI